MRVLWNGEVLNEFGPMTRSRTKQSVNTLQQMVAEILNEAQMENDESSKAETLLRISIVAEGQD